ncbi:MAG TPA: hypothetical protein VID77_02095 [Stellaceae bacterium]|jgi:ABC-type polysaccharide/polyol phosphate transport system ATPase subunit
MIALDCVTMVSHGRAPLRRASFDFTPGIWHVAAEQPGDARMLIHLLAGQIAPQEGAVCAAGRRSWPLGQTMPLGAALTGIDTIDTLASLYGLHRGETLALFRALLTAPVYLSARLERWPPALQRQFAQIAYLAPPLDIYLLDVSPILPDAKFMARWLPLFRERIAGKVAIVAAEHRAALRDLPGARLMLRDGALRRIGERDAIQSAMAAE